MWNSPIPSCNDVSFCRQCVGVPSGGVFKSDFIAPSYYVIVRKRRCLFLCHLLAVLSFLVVGHWLKLLTIIHSPSSICSFLFLMFWLSVMMSSVFRVLCLLLLTELVMSSEVQNKKSLFKKASLTTQKVIHDQLKQKHHPDRLHLRISVTAEFRRTHS